jgi:integrase
VNRTQSSRRRRAGEGSIYQTADGRWRGAVRYTDATGKAQRKVVSGQTMAIVRERLTALVAGLDRGMAPASSLALADYLAGWLEADRPRVRATTWRAREQHVRLHIGPHIGRIPLAKLTPTDVERFQARLLEAGLSPLSVRHVRATLRRALTDAIRDGLVIRNAGALARPPRLPHRPIEYLTADQVHQLLDHVAAQRPLGTLVPVAVSTGLRLGELLGLAWSDVDTDAKTLRVRQAMIGDGHGGYLLSEPKSGRSRRMLPLPQMAVDALTGRRAQWRADRLAAGPDWQDRDDLVFSDRLGRPLKGRDVSSMFRRHADAIGLSIGFHGLRHTAATLALAAGEPITSVSAMLGHSGIAITVAHYAAVVPDLQRDTANAMDRALARR